MSCAALAAWCFSLAPREGSVVLDICSFPGSFYRSDFVFWGLVCLTLVWVLVLRIVLLCPVSFSRAQESSLGSQGLAL